MNKYFIIIGIVVVILGAGIGYRTFLLPEESKPIVTGVEREITIIAQKDQWIFEPEFIEVDKGDKIILTMTNRDIYDHGIAIDAFGIAQRMPARATVVTDFIVTQGGDFPFYCSVPCGEGYVNGEFRTHFDMIGVIHSRSLVSETFEYGEKSLIATEKLKQETRKRAIESVANRNAKELGYNVDNMEIVYDTENTAWIKYIGDLTQLGKEYDFIKNNEYQVVYYRDPGHTHIDLWVFIDAVTGDFIMHRKGE